MTMRYTKSPIYLLTVMHY